MTVKHRMDQLLKKNGLTAAELLMKIHDMLNPEQHKNRYEFYQKNKANFSQMIAGNRKFKFEYVVPLERILHTTMDYIMNGEEPNEGMQFRKKGFAYTAYTNDYEEFVKLGAETNQSGDRILSRCDEYDKDLIDYIIEFQAEQGIRYLADHCAFHYRHSAFNSEPHTFVADITKQLNIVKLLVAKKEGTLLCHILDPYQRLLYDWESDGLFHQVELYDLILSDDSVLKEFLTDQAIRLDKANHSLASWDYSFDEGMFVNPFIHDLLARAMQNSNQHRSAIQSILYFGIDFNKRLLDFATEHFASFCEDIRVGEHGYIFDQRTKISSMVTYDSAVIPDTPPEIKKLLFTLAAQKNVLLNLKSPLVAADTITADGKYIWKQSSHNPIEYELYRICSEKGISEVPRYYETQEGLDRIDHMTGKAVKRVGYDMPDQVTTLVHWLKSFHAATADNLQGKVFVHGCLDRNAVLFDDDQISGIIHWENCRYGDRHEDLVNIFIDWFDIGNPYRRNDILYATLLKVLEEYGADSALRAALPGLIYQQLEDRINNLDKTDDHYEFAYEYLRHAQTFVELYGDRIRES